MIKKSVYQEDITEIYVSLYIFNIRKILTDLRGEIYYNIIVTGDFNTPLSTVGRSTQKINRETLDLNYTLDHLDLEAYIEHYI